MTQYKPGARLRSAVCTTEVVVVAAPPHDVELACGGVPMLTEGEAAFADMTVKPDDAGGSLLGKRYTDESGELEVLCVKAGDGSLSVGSAAMVIKGAKPLPSSD